MTETPVPTPAPTSAPAPAPTTGQVADFYDVLGPLLSTVWDDNYHFGYWDGPDDPSTVAEATDRFTDVVVEALGAGPDDLVLDVGCGVGKPACRLARTSGATVVGISINRRDVAEATTRARREGLTGRVSFREADAMTMPFDDASFDAALALESIIHMDRPRALREIRRVLRPGGRLVLTDLLAPAYATRPQAPKLSSLVDLRTYPELITAAGLDLVELTDVTVHTARTVPVLATNLLAHREEFERRQGTTLEQAVASTAADGVNPLDIGCLVAVARRPEPA